MTACSLPLRRTGFDGVAPDWRVPPVWPVAATVLAFIVWWPLGLLALAMWKGRHLLGALPHRLGAWHDEHHGHHRGHRHHRGRHGGGRGPTGNTAFDEHRAAVLRRLDEERAALDAQQREFGDFLAQLRRAKDREEFDRFMAERGRPTQV